MSEKTWTDQPDAFERGTVVVGGLGIGDQVAEVRKLDDGRYGLTIGNLFGSQSLYCADADALLRALDRVSHGKCRGVPEGCTLAEEEAQA